jgi:hypothetical protein
MGGFGSGRGSRCDTRLTTDDCYWLDVNWLKRGGYLATGKGVVIRGPIEKGIEGLALALVNGIWVDCKNENRLTLREF